MGLGSTFTNSIVREIGRNYGKAISNSLMGNSHSTPINIINTPYGSTKQRGVRYENKLDQYLNKFQIKGKIATFNQGQNMFNSFFELVEEAKVDGEIDLFELSYLASKVQDTTRGLNKVESALKELGDEKGVEIIAQKKTDLYEFLEELESGLIVQNLESPKFGKKDIIGILLMFLCLDRIFFYPRFLWSYFWAFYGVICVLWALKIESLNGGTGFYFLLVSLSLYWLVINPISRGGFWNYIRIKGYLKKKIVLTKEMKILLRKMLGKV